ncbi:MAG: phosphatidylcholine/phosphatidylserine synthase [Rickettsiaceae bacterium]|nr:phosphatidylcholine/phosphatidylserine synthase [Rickettsiaceae bacterium]
MIKFRRKRKLITRPVPFVHLFPNVVTLLGLIIGISSIRFALEHRWEEAIYCILIATIIDGMDGIIARFLNATSHFGAELDSLCDLVNFGFCPSIITYLWLFDQQSVEKISWGCSLFFTVCMAIRLARFNTNITTPKTTYFFQGVPAPSGAMLVLMPIILQFKFLPLLNMANLFIPSLYINIYVIFIALLVASRLPTISLKKIVISPKYLTLVMLIFAVTIIALYMYTWYVLPIAAILYLISIPVCLYKTHQVNDESTQHS